MSESITSTPDAPKQSDGANDEGTNNSPKRRTPWIGIGITIIFGLLLVALVAWVSRVYIRNPPEDTKAAIPGILGVLTLVVIAIQVWVNQQQWKAMQESLDETRKLGEHNDQVIRAMNSQVTTLAAQAGIMQTQSIAAREQAIQLIGQSDLMSDQLELTKQDIKGAEENLIFSQRAYVTAAIADHSGGDFILRIENGGNTPANGVVLSMNAGWLEKPPEPCVNWDAAWDTGIPTVMGVIAPKDHQKLKVFMPSIDQEKTKKFQTGLLNYYCWGTICYSDIFHQPRISTFAFYRSSDHPTGAPCEAGNEAK